MKLKSNEVICPKCEGKKFTDVHYTKYYKTLKLCSKCKGTGKLDWIDNMLNRQTLKFDTFEHISLSNQVSNTMSYSAIISEELIL